MPLGIWVQRFCPEPPKKKIALESGAIGGVSEEQKKRVRKKIWLPSIGIRVLREGNEG